MPDTKSRFSSPSDLARFYRLESIITQERLRQARLSFNLALIATATAAAVTLIGAGLLLAGKATEGAVTTTGGLASSVCCAQLAKDTNDRLDKILAERRDTEVE
jgi:hypothetical protein